MSYDRQNYYLDICEDNTISLPESGTDIILPPGSKILLIGNTEGFGVHPNHEALLDRLQKIHWDISYVEAIADQSFTKWELVASKRRTGDSIYGIKLGNRKITKKVAFDIVRATYPINRIKKGAMNLRRYKEYFNLYETCADIYVFIDRICERLNREILVNEDMEGKKLLSEIRSALEYNLL